jgi:phosphatidylglycerophosphate synthase
MVDTGNRRPIAARNLATFQTFASWLAPRLSANAVSLLGLACGLGAGAALAATACAPGRAWWLVGAVLVQLRLLANLLDGMVAERAPQASRLGALYNEVPDRITDAAALVGLGYALGGDASLGWLAAILATLTNYVRALGASLTGRQHFVGPFAKQQRMAVVTLVALVGAVAPGWIGQPLVGGLAAPALALAVIAVGCALTAWRRLRLVAHDLDGGAR